MHSQTYIYYTRLHTVTQTSISIINIYTHMWDKLTHSLTHTHTHTHSLSAKVTQIHELWHIDP